MESAMFHHLVSTVAQKVQTKHCHFMFILRVGCLLSVLRHICKGKVRRGVFIWVQSATSLLVVILDLQCCVYIL